MESGTIPQKNSVLVVDDDLEALAEMSEALRDTGLTVFEANNGEDAVLTAKSRLPAFVVMDYRLPGMNGLQSIDVMKQFLPDTVFIVVTGVDAFRNQATIDSTQVYSILQKPLNIDVIARFIHTKLDHGDFRVESAI